MKNKSCFHASKYFAGIIISSREKPSLFKLIKGQQIHLDFIKIVLLVCCISCVETHYVIQFLFQIVTFSDNDSVIT